MQEHFYNVAYKVYENGIVKSHDSCLLRSSKVPTLDAAKAHIRSHFLKNPTAVITISHVTSLSQEVYKKLGATPTLHCLTLKTGKKDYPEIKVPDYRSGTVIIMLHYLPDQ
jgi:hypothetical protein